MEAGAPQQQEQLAKWFKDRNIITTGAMLNKYKNLDAAPRVNQCRQFAMALGVCVEWLYTGRGPKHAGPSYDEQEQSVIDALREIDDIGERTDWFGYLRVALRRDHPPDQNPGA